jgi:hypothetical protein
MLYSNSNVPRLYRNAAHFIIGISLVLLSYSIAPDVWANETSVNEIEVAQAQLTTDQIPTSQLSNSTELEYGDRIDGALNASSVRHQGRRFAIYQFAGEAGQFIRINLVGGLASERSPNQLQTGSLLINPVVILVDPNGEIIAQQPEETNVANALILKELPSTGTYNILVTSATVGGGGQYTLTLQQSDMR